jgi:predicted metalloprotease
MRWRQARRSTNVEDRRGRGVAGGRPVALGGGALVLVVVVALLMGENPLELLSLVGGTDGAMSTGGSPTFPDTGVAATDEATEFVERVLGDTEDTWTGLFALSGKSYEVPTLVLFTDAVDSACGFSTAAVGPFYCPADRKVYIDLGFYRDLHERFGAPGDFAQAYVIAHEVGHHVQNLLGISEEVRRLQARSSEAEGNALSVRLELQADCLAGVWGHHAGVERQILETGDVEEGLRAAAAIGDDRMQRASTGRISPESWTHGSSEQRARWFGRGLETGRVESCDTFAAEIL